MNSDLNSTSGYGWIYKVALLFILAIVAFFLIAEHRAHLVAYSGTIFFIIFILLHFFMHRGHGGHGGCGGHGRRDEGQQHEHNKEPEEKHDIDKVGEPQNTSQHEHSPEENKL